MRLYIWDQVLTDYSDGMAFAVADTLEDAYRAAATREGVVQGHVIEALPLPTQTIEIVDGMEPVGAYVWGGG